MSVALNISSRNIKVLSLKGRQVKKWSTIDLAGGLVRDGLILQPQAVGEAIDSLFKSTRMPRDNVVTSIAGLSFTYRFLSLPRLKPSLQEEAILRAAKKEISLPLDELYLAWQSIPGKGEEQAFFILGVPRNLVDAAVQTLKFAGVTPYLMDLRPLALARTANRRDAIVVNLEPDCFDIVFITNGLPTVIHTISPRSESATLEDNIHRLADELTKTAAFYQSNHPDIQLSPSTPLLLTGDLAIEAPASGLLQSEIEYPIEPLIPPVEFPDNLPLASYAASIGLALKRTPQKPPARVKAPQFSPININILAGKYRKPRAKPVRLKYILFVIFMVVAVGCIYPLYQVRTNLSTENKGLETDLNNANRALDLANLVNEETLQTEDSIREITAAAEAIKKANQSILGTRGNFTAGLRLVTGAMPPATYFTSIEIMKDAISVKGETDSVFTVVAYATALESQGVFKDVRITMLDETTVTPSGAEGTFTPGAGVITFEILMDKPISEVSASQ
jgi:Tfp pilus assembly protein PilN